MSHTSLLILSFFHTWSLLLLSWNFFYKTMILQIQSYNYTSHIIIDLKIYSYPVFVAYVMLCYVMETII